MNECEWIKVNYVRRVSYCVYAWFCFEVFSPHHSWCSLQDFVIKLTSDLVAPTHYTPHSIHLKLKVIKQQQQQQQQKHLQQLQTTPVMVSATYLVHISVCLCMLICVRVCYAIKKTTQVAASTVASASASVSALELQHQSSVECCCFLLLSQIFFAIQAAFVSLHNT